MSIKVKQEDGSEIEAFTAEELAAKSKEVSEAAVTAEAERLKAEHESALLEKDEALNEAKDKLKKAEDKETNFKALRDKAEKGGKEKSEEEKKNAEDLKALQETVQQIQKQPFETAKTNFIKNNVGADKELGEKFDFFYKKLSTGVKSVEEQQVALESAMTLATGKPYESGSGGMTRTSVNADFGGINAKPESKDSQNFGTLLGITADDKKSLAGKNGTIDLLKPSAVKEKNV